MKHPHPVLAAAARVLLGAAVAEAVLTLALLLYAPRDLVWYGARAVEAWTLHPPAVAAEATWARACDAAGLAAPPLGLLLAGWLLRLAATDRLRPAADLRAAGTPARVGLAVAGSWAALAASDWVAPFAGDQALPVRLRGHIRAGTWSYAAHHPIFGSGGGSSGTFRRGESADPPPLEVRVVVTATSEAVGGLAAVRPAAVLFCLCGVAFCLGRPDPHADPGASA